MPLVDATNVISTVSQLDPTQLLLTISVFFVMVSLISLCSCCRNNKNERKEQDECDYGVVTVAATANTNVKPPPIHTINFRDTISNRIHERHSQPAANMNIMSFNRQSAPGRALPKLPADLYTAIDKKPKPDDIRFVDEAVNPMYECIDAETDSFVDPLYSKIGNPSASAATKDRRYDYPIFSGRQNQNKPQNEELMYQSASQIYAAGSEDPYSSITSDRERRDGDGDTSSAYDPGYAKVKPNEVKPNEIGKKKDKLERKERELDLLYSKIRRSVPTYGNDNMPGPSRIEPNLPNFAPIDPIPQVAAFDQQSAVSSREPSYRYITMRENAEIVRERLRQQGQLNPPRREHYYSTIGNDYETINNPPSTSANDTIVSHEGLAPLANISTMIEIDVPLPPTSPVPEYSRPVSYIETGGSTSNNAPIPPPPDLRCSPVPPRPPCESQTFSIMKAEPYSSHRSIYGHDANAPSSSYRSMETLLGRRTMEEKETIIEQRSTFATGVPIPSTSNSTNIMSRSVDNPYVSKPVHEVTIRRLEKNYDSGPGADEIISGRRYRSVGGLTDDLNQQSDRISNDKKNGTSSDNVKRETTFDVESTASVSDSEPTTSRKSARKKPWKEESEEDRIKRLGTIYTANDYVSQMDMTNEKPWPMKNTN